MNRFVKFWRLVVLRAVILFIYKPIAERLPFLTRWSIPLRGTTLNHQKLLLRAGSQVIMDDEMVAFAVPDYSQAPAGRQGA